jgi:hypothetical protein
MSSKDRSGQSEPGWKRWGPGRQLLQDRCMEELCIEEDHTTRQRGVTTQNTTILNNGAGHINEERLMKSLYMLYIVDLRYENADKHFSVEYIQYDLFPSKQYRDCEHR